RARRQINTAVAYCARTPVAVTIWSQALGNCLPRCVMISACDFGDWSVRVPSPIEKPTSAVRNQTPLLTELDDDSLRVSASDALECTLILEHPFGRLNLRRNHRQSAFRASSLPDRGICRIEILGLRHWFKPLDRVPFSEGKRTGLTASV